MASPVQRPSARTLLLADDDPGVRSIARRMLEEGGYRVVEASDGVQAWASFLRTRRASTRCSPMW
jgi:CheY-like chemotaxis protein